MKKLRRVLCAVMAAVTMLSVSVCANAESDIDGSVLLTEAVLSTEPDDEGFVLVSEETFVNEDGVTVTHRSYIKDNGISPCGVISKGEADIREEADYSVDVTKWVTLWVKGHFKWDSAANTSCVTILDHGYKKHNQMAWVVGVPELTSKDNQGGYWGGKKYSYIEQKITLDNGIHVGLNDGKETFRLWVDVNVNGEKKVKT